MPKSTATLGDILAKVFKATALPWDSATQFDLHLHTADPGVGGISTTSEATYTNYALVTVNRSGAAWTTTGGPPATAKNAAIIQFPQCGASGNTITHVSITPNASTQILYYGALNASLAVANLIQPQFAINALVITES